MALLSVTCLTSNLPGKVLHQLMSSRYKIAAVVQYIEQLKSAPEGNFCSLSSTQGSHAC